MAPDITDVPGEAERTKARKGGSHFVDGPDEKPKKDKKAKPEKDAATEEGGDE